MNISLRQMRAFSAVARAGSFTAGARQVNLTQSAVSMLVQQLEESLGVTLFDRGAAVTLTEAGRQLLPLARRILDDVNQVVEGASDLRSLRTGLLRVVAPQMLGCTWIATVLGEFAALHPDIGLRVTDATTDDVVGVVRRGEAEIGVGPERTVGEDVTRTFLMDVPIRMVCPATHPLAQRRGVSWDELRDERWVIYSSEFNRQLERILQSHDASLSMQTAVEVGYLTTALAMVGVGSGLAAVPDYARMFADNFKVRFVPLRGPEIRRQFYIYQRRGMALSPAAQAFVAMMQRHAARGTSKA
ncbi:LysR family transcriptional regulator [Variovorax ginsengisoli]|uniref:DNA-binding transcriptional LysR family regulator n=1 Tax=Variovorax ginsengisoli TaxID=363844 RepID=A0ABT9S2B1_9BURK|nr:LysR family transcriptional regulator [Variovorax ginsengisoli]MDP9898494.1 DNA-binding transcriptional LysR family regulator [Variovorax ginsengisoli]